MGAEQVGKALIMHLVCRELDMVKLSLTNESYIGQHNGLYTRGRGLADGAGFAAGTAAKLQGDQTDTCEHHGPGFDLGNG